MKSFWISWWHDIEKLGEFELHSPWWRSGIRMSDDAESICAAIQGYDEAQAKERVLMSYDERPEDLEWRFVEERPDDWSPFSGRFPRAAWMQWP